MAVVLFTSFTVFEHKGIITYGRFKRTQKVGAKGNLKMLLDRHIVKFSLVSILTGVVRTSVMFWLPTYFAERLEMGGERATLTYTVATLFISCGSFIVIFLYEKIGHDLDKTLLIMFSAAALFFALTYFVTMPYVNVVLIVLAIMASNGAATMLWSRYCPSLRDTGIVSGVTGFLDFLSYMAAGTMDLVTTHIVNGVAWSGMMLVCLGFMVVGIVISLPWKKLKKNA
jgi:sugar phosphate permease